MASTPSCVTRGRATTRPWPITATGWCSNCSTAGSARTTSPYKGRFQAAGINARQIGNDAKPPLVNISTHDLYHPKSAIGRGGSSKPSDGLKGKFPHYRYYDMVES